MTYARAGRLTLAGLALVAASACTGGDPADGDPTTAPPTSASPTPTVAAPTIPPAAQEHTADGAAAFVKYWIKQVDVAATTGSVTALRSGATTHCKACSELADRYEAIYANGGSSESPGWRPTVTSSQLIADDYYVTIDLATVSHRYWAAADSPAKSVNANTYHDLYRLKWVDGRWAIDDIREQDIP